MIQHGAVFETKNVKSKENSKKYTMQIHTFLNTSSISYISIYLYILTFYKVLSTAEAYTVWKESIFRVILVRIFPHLDWKRRDTEYLYVFSPN